MGPVVLKFGGTSVQDAQALRRAAAIVAGTAGPKIVVVSALAGVTNALDGIAAMPPGPTQSEALVAILDRHLEQAYALVDGALQGALIDHLAALFERAAAALNRAGAPERIERDALLATGELAASRLVAAVLHSAGTDARWVDARRAIVSDERFGAARPLAAETRSAVAREIQPELASGRVPVLGGFVAATRDGRTSTLGRGGSDYSASVIAAAVHASRVDIYTDVDGILSADPRVVPEAALLARVSTLEAYDLARFGARVLHAGALEPVAEPRIPVFVRNARRPSAACTAIQSSLDPEGPAVVGLAHRPGVSVIDLVARDLGASARFADRVSACVDHGANHAVTPISVSPQRAVVAVDDARSADELCGHVGDVADVASVERGGLVAVVGQGVHSDPGVWRALLELRDRADVRRVVPSSSGCALVAITAAGAADRVVQKLHGAGIGRVLEVA